MVLHNGQFLTEEEKASLKTSREKWVNHRTKVSVTTFTPMRSIDADSTVSAIVLMQNIGSAA